MKQNIIKFLPLIIIFFSVVGVLSWYAKNKKDQPEIKPEVVNPADLEADNLVLSPTPTTSFFFQNDSEIEGTQPSILPETTEPEEKGFSSDSVAPSDSSDVEPIYTKTITCTPVYGMADTCTEHIVVDTGAESAVAYSLSAFSYLAGLIAFVKSKKT